MTENFSFSNFFDFLSESELNYLVDNSQDMKYFKGDFIFKTNTKAENIFFITKGKIKLYKQGINAKGQITRFANPGDVIGYRSLMSEDKHRLSAYCMGDCEAKVIAHEVFTVILKKNNELLFDLTKKVCNDLKMAEEHILSMSQKNVRERTAEALWFFIRTYGFEDDKKTLNVQFSREEIASYVGTSTESVIRVLSEFNADGIIKIQKKKILILDKDRLIETANFVDESYVTSSVFV